MPVWLAWAGARALLGGKWLLRNPIALIALLWALTGLYAVHERHRADKAVKVLHSTEVAWRAASAQAERNAHDARAATEQSSRALAVAQDQANRADMVRVRDAVSAYADSHRVRSCPAQGGSGQAVAPALPDDPAHAADGVPAAPVGGVVVSETDLRDLTQGAVQARAARIYLQGLIDRGLAVRE